MFRPQQWYANNTTINDLNILRQKVIWKYNSLKQINNDILFEFINWSYCLSYLNKNINNLTLRHKSFLDDVFKKLERIEKNKNINKLINLFKELDKLFIEWYWNNKKNIQ